MLKSINRLSRAYEINTPKIDAPKIDVLGMTNLIKSLWLAEFGMVFTTFMDES